MVWETICNLRNFCGHNVQSHCCTQSSGELVQDVLIVRALNIKHCRVAYEVIKFHDELNETVGTVDSVCQELSRTLDDKELALRSTVQS